MRRWLLPLAVATGLLGGCVTAPESTREPRPETPARKEAPREKKVEPGLSAEAQRALARRGIKPHETKPLSVVSKCRHVDEIGTATRLDLRVEAGAVEALDAEVAIKGRGRCNFRLADFRQEGRAPSALLRHAREPKCTVQLWWEQQDKMALAFNGCPKSCEGNAFEYLWPILVEPKTGQCF